MKNKRKHPILKKAPIVEALLDFQFIREPAAEATLLEKFSKIVIADYPTRKSKRSWTGQVNFEANKLPEILPPTEKPAGFMFYTKDKKRIIQVAADKFTFNQLNPYRHWRDFINEGKKRWNEFSKIFGPVQVRRIGLRYINRIELPLPFHDFKEYLKTAPEIAPDIPQDLSEVFMRVVVPNHDLKCHAIITLASEQAREAKLPLILDIDVVKLPPIESDPGRFWKQISSLRDFKNEIFFGSLTKKTLRIYQ